MNFDARARLRLYAANATRMWERTGAASGMAVEVCESVPALLDHIDQVEAQVQRVRAVIAEVVADLDAYTYPEEVAGAVQDALDSTE